MKPYSILIVVLLFGIAPTYAADRVVKNQSLELSVVCPEDFKASTEESSPNLLLVYQRVGDAKPSAAFVGTLIPVNMELPKENVAEFIAGEIIAAAKQDDPKVDHTPVKSVEVAGVKSAYFEITRPGQKRSCNWVVFRNAKIYLFSGTALLEEVEKLRPQFNAIINSLTWVAPA